MKPSNEKGGKKCMYKKSKRFLAGFLALLLTVIMLSTDMLSVVYAEEEMETVETEKSESIEDKTDEVVLEDAKEAETLENAEPEEETVEADDTLKVEENASEPSTEDSSEFSTEDSSESSSTDEIQEPTTVEVPVFNPEKESETYTEGELDELTETTAAPAEETVEEVIQSEAVAYPVEVSIIPIISEADLAKLGDSAVYFTANDEADVSVHSGEEVKLKKDHEYRVEIKNADGEAADGLTAAINNSTTYIPTENASVTIEIMEMETQSIAQYSNLTASEAQARAAAENYTVKFYDSYENEIIDSRITIKAGENNLITLPDVTTQKIGSTFKGWNDSYYWNTYKAGSSYTVSRDVEFYEYWEEVYYDKGMYVQMDDWEAYYQGGTAVTPDVRVYYNNEELTLGTDYTIKYKNNKNAGTATVTVTGKGNFAGAVQKDVPFTIRPADIRGTDYTGKMTVIKNAKVNPVIMYNGKQLKLNKDFTISGDGLENGKYTAATAKTNLTVTGINNFSGTFDIEVGVVETAKKFAVEIDKGFKPVYGDLSYNDWSPSYATNLFKSNKIKVYEKGNSAKQLEWGTDFQVVAISGSILEAGTFKFMVIGMGEYSGNVTKSFKISPKPLADSDIEISAYCYDEQQNKWEYKTSGLTAAYDPAGSTLILRVRYKTGTSTTYSTMGSWNYKVSYSGNKKVGAGRAKITFINDYKGTKPKTVDFTITGASLSETTAAVPDMVYTKAGKSYVSKPIVEYEGSIIKASEYTASYAWRSSTSSDWNTDDKVKITLGENEPYAIVRVTLTANAKGNFVGTKTIDNYYVRKVDDSRLDLSKAKVEFFSDADLKMQYKKIPYCGSEFYTPMGNDAASAERAGAVYVKVTIGKDTVVSPSLYDVIWLNAVNKGKATVIIKGKGYLSVNGKSAIGSTTANITIDSVGQWITPSNPN